MADTPEGRALTRRAQLADLQRDLDAAQRRADEERTRDAQEKAWRKAAAERRAARDAAICKPSGAGFVIAPKTILGPPSPTENEP